MIMMTPIHMKDQIHNTIEELMNEKKSFDWDEFFQNVTMLSLIAFFMSFGLNW